MEYLDTKNVVKIGLELVKSAKEPKIVLASKTKTFSKVKSPINLLYLLKAWKTGQKGSDRTMKVWFLQGYPRFFAIYMIMILKSNYSNGLAGQLGLKFLKL